MDAISGEEGREVLDRYMSTADSNSCPSVLSEPFLPFDICTQIETTRWQFSMIEQLVRGELRELTNTLNEWHGALRRWAAWLDVLDSYPDEKAWKIQWEFVESIAFQCLFYPSATRDRFSFVATNALHQVRLAAKNGYKDELDQDPKKPDGKPRFLSRSANETQVARIAAPLPGGGAKFVSALQSLDGEDYRNLTKNFRNLASHAIAPRLSIGFTSTVVREVRAATRLVKHGDLAYKEEVIPGKRQVSYGFGGTQPIPIRQAFEHNVSEFEKARNCFFAYVHLLDTALCDLASGDEKV